MGPRFSIELPAAEVSSGSHPDILSAECNACGHPSVHSPDAESDPWFTENLLPHEAALRSYLQRSFASLPDKDDIVQEAYQRVLAAQRKGIVRFPRAFLFTTARNMALDTLRRMGRVSLEAMTPLNESLLMEPSRDPAESLLRHQELELLAEAVADLPQRCRDVVLLRYLEGMSYKEIAARLAITPETVKTHLSKGLQRCIEHFGRRG